MELFRGNVDCVSLIKQKEEEWNSAMQVREWRDGYIDSDSKPKNPYSSIGSDSLWIERLKLRYNLFMDLKYALKEYHEALILQKKLLAVPSPAHRTTETLSKWFAGINDEGPDELPLFEGSSAHIFGLDMISLGPVRKKIQYPMRLSNMSPLGSSYAKKDSDEKTQYTNEKKVGRTVGVINMLAAIGMLVVAVWVLSVVSDYKLGKSSKVSTQTELAVMTGFIVLFAIWVQFFTAASKKEVFGAVAAYAAVLVVFVGSSGGS
ncbi:hypothetical protein V8E51_008656 [Hyaloscypha variabilis]